MSLRENELDVLAKYLGHDIRIHREYYRLPDAAVQVAKISKVLIALEGKNGDPVQLMNAKNLHDLHMDPEEGRVINSLYIGP